MSSSKGVATATESSEPDYDVIIIGSGIAGLYTGVELLRRVGRGIRVAVIERGERLGGRVFTYKGKVEGAAVQWEAGAGRISSEHTIILGLLRRYKLHWVPIGASIEFKGTVASPLEPNAFEPAIPIMIDTLAGLPAAVLAHNTIRSLLTRIHGPVAADNYLIRFPYRAEVDIMRADMALEVFRGEMRAHEGYGICKEGLSALIDAMAADFQRRGGVIQRGKHLHDVAHDRTTGEAVCSFKGEGSGNPLRARHVVLAIPAAAAAELPALASWRTLRRVRMTPLLRLYGVFPKGGPAGPDKLWYEGVGSGGRIVTAGHVRYMIPGSAAMGSAQISYTDSQDAEYWMERLRVEGQEAVGRAVVHELREWVDPRIPTPKFVKAHPWEHGVTYWLPGSYDPVAESRAAVQPLPAVLPSVWLCGESYSLRQAWMEGAVEHAELMLGPLLKKVAAHTKKRASHAR
jgi:predicted NAD/FAD-dependent oxidoreductase